MSEIQYDQSTYTTAIPAQPTTSNSHLLVMHEHHPENEIVYLPKGTKLVSVNRDTQFLGFAKLLFDDIEPMFNNRFIELDNGERQEAEKTKQSILECFAECAYDLACHVVENLDEDVAWRKGKGSTAGQIVENDIPDLTKWPEESK